MNVVSRRPMDRDEFLVWEMQQQRKFEFDGTQPVAMTGGTAAHAAIQRNLITALTNRLRGQPCRPFGSELKIDVAGSFRYPDAFVVCVPVAPKDRVVTEPVVVFEVLSESTAATDRIRKNCEYRDTPSIQRYVILEQDEIGAMVFYRSHEDWVGHVQGPGATLAMPEIGIELPLDELYEGIVFAVPE